MLLALGAVCIVLAVRPDQFASSSGIDWLDQLARDMIGVIGRPTAPALAAALGVFLWWRGVGIGSGG